MAVSNDFNTASFLCLPTPKRWSCHDAKVNAIWSVARHLVSEDGESLLTGTPAASFIDPPRRPALTSDFMPCGTADAEAGAVMGMMDMIDDDRSSIVLRTT